MMLPRLVTLLLGAACALPLSAAEDVATQAKTLREQAKALRAQADDRLATALPACYERFLVNRCIANAKEAHLEQVREARQLEIEAGRLELAERRKAAEAAGRTRTDAPTEAGAPVPLESMAAPPDAADEATRRQREADAARAAEAARTERAQRDAEKARARAQAEAEAAERAAAAARDRARYEERIRERKAE